MQGPIEFVAGVAKGVTGLGQKSVEGVFGGLERMTKGVSQQLVSLTFDTEYQQKTDMAQ